jgi:ABC-2 type transport system ATP-binding protein
VSFVLKASAAITVEGVDKSFRVPVAKPSGQWFLGLTRRHTDLSVLSGVSFEVAQGEMFGVAGRNGSGKSTLLKVLAGIYPADAGTVVLRGRLAQALEPGVGFSPELSTRQNAVINGVMLGLTRSEARRRVDSILDFADLRDFSRMRLKDLSSGMRMRLALATMFESDPDVMLIDEFLAGGDRAFQEKCSEALTAFRKRGRTIVFVTHAMGVLESLCDRALVLERGRVRHIGNPASVAARYLEINLPEHGEAIELVDEGDRRREAVRIVETFVTDDQGTRRTVVDPQQDLVIEAELEILQPLKNAALMIEIRNERGARIFVSRRLDLHGHPVELRRGQRARTGVRVENRLHPGKYSIRVTVVKAGRRGRDVPASPSARVPLRVAGSARRGAGAVALRHRVLSDRVLSDVTPISKNGSS